MINETMAMAFLLEIGRWAKNELSEIWKLKHKQKEADLSNERQTELIM